MIFHRLNGHQAVFPKDWGKISIILDDASLRGKISKWRLIVFMLVEGVEK